MYVHLCRLLASHGDKNYPLLCLNIRDEKVSLSLWCYVCCHVWLCVFHVLWRLASVVEPSSSNRGDASLHTMVLP